MTDTPSPSDQAVKVLIVEDSPIIRSLIRRMLDEQEDVTVVEMAENGKIGIEKAILTKPDVILLDIEMPVMTGLEALPELRRQVPDAKVIIVSTLSYAGAEVTLEALEKGATDFIQKPTMNNGMPIEDFTRELLSRVLVLGKGNHPKPVIAEPFSPPQSTKTPLAPIIKPAPIASDFSIRNYTLALPPKILAIGSSTGGPEALITFFKNLQGKFNCNIPIVITQHMPAFFTSVFASHIAKASDMPAKEAETGDILEPRTIYIAPGDYHMTFEKEGDHTKIILNQGPAVNFCRPAVDPMFNSLLSLYKGSSILAAIFTGMGHDGLEASRHLVAKGGMVVAQDKKSSVVWGMPGAVASEGLCSAVLPLEEMADYISKICNGGAS